MAIYVMMVICGLVFVAFPVIYFGELDATSAIVLSAGIVLLVWTALRVRSLRRKSLPPSTASIAKWSTCDRWCR